MAQSSPKIIVISGPSGIGKTTIVNAVLARMPSLKRIVTYTTRPPRPQEINNQAYHFVSHDAFKVMAQADGFLEWAALYGDNYGSPKHEVNTIIEQDKNPLLILDVQGEETLRKKGTPHVSIFLEPESFDQIKNHILKDVGLHQRSNNPQDLEMRLETARKELTYARYYTYRIVNKEGDIEGSVATLKALLETILQE